MSLSLFTTGAFALHYQRRFHRRSQGKSENRNLKSRAHIQVLFLVKSDWRLLGQLENRESRLHEHR